MFKTNTGDLRSPRKIAEEKGAAPAGFAGWDYDSAGGVPDRARSAGQKYDERTVTASPVNSPAAAQRKPF
jgi:hypothetical protein